MGGHSHADDIDVSYGPDLIMHLLLTLGTLEIVWLCLDCHVYVRIMHGNIVPCAIQLHHLCAPWFFPVCYNFVLHMEFTSLEIQR